MGWLESLIFRSARCDLCGITGVLRNCLCADCLNDLPQGGPRCLRCGRPVPRTVTECGKCLVTPLLADRTVTAFHYTYPIDALIKQFKYHQKIRLAAPLARVLAEEILSHRQPLPEVMIPVPLHNRRLYGRGYNQAIVIADALAACLGIAVDWRLVSRIRNTAPMFSLGARQRRRNISGVFSLQRPCAYRSVAIVDDVITSGSTVNELARTLRLAGVVRIEFWALARAE